MPTLSSPATTAAGISRRTLLRGGAALGASAFAFTALGGRPAWAAQAYPFTLGVASGDPLPGGIVLWTRLAPDPLAEDGHGGMPDKVIPVQWEVATDERFANVVARGTEPAKPKLGHSVHAEVDGLQAGAEYFYRFLAGSEISPVGRTRTAPEHGARLDRFSFAFTSCQNFMAGHYTALGHMAQEDLDLVVQLGDYIYEQGPNVVGIRNHTGTGETVTLSEYRNRYAQYRGDPDLQAAHAAHPWAVVLDDHEIDNNWADEVAQDPHLQPRDAFLARRAAAFQAYYEHLPLRRTSLPDGIDMQLYRRLTFGDLVDLHILDTRQYRSDQGGPRKDPTRTILGDDQEAWVHAALAGHTARWNVLAQQVFFSQRDLTLGSGKSYSGDAWDGYVADRDSLRDHMVAAVTTNPVILTGDVHANYVCDIKADFDDPSSATVATELVGTSISSLGDGMDQDPADPLHMSENPHIKFINRNRGYVRNTVTASEWTTDFRVVDFVTVPGAPVRTRATYVVEDGRPGGQPA